MRYAGIRRVRRLRLLDAAVREFLLISLNVEIVGVRRNGDGVRLVKREQLARQITVRRDFVRVPEVNAVGISQHHRFRRRTLKVHPHPVRMRRNVAPCVDVVRVRKARDSLRMAAHNTTRLVNREWLVIFRPVIRHLYRFEGRIGSREINFHPEVTRPGSVPHIRARRPENKPELYCRHIFFADVNFNVLALVVALVVVIPCGPVEQPRLLPASPCPVE